MARRDQPVVLIAEDNENDIAMLRRAFRQASVTAPIQYVTDGEQVIAYLKGQGKFARRDEFPLPELKIGGLFCEEPLAIPIAGKEMLTREETPHFRGAQVFAFPMPGHHDVQ